MCKAQHPLRHFVFLALFFLSFQIKAETRAFDKIIIKGLKRTQEIVVLTELGFKIGDKVSQSTLELGVNEVRNTDLFSQVTHQVLKRNNQTLLIIKVEERWTTIPIFKVSSGGGINQFVAGVYDPNIFGKYLELGAQYEKLGDADSGVAWFRNPRLWNSRYGLDLQLWKTNRIRTKYVQENQDPTIKTGFLHERDKLFLGLNREFSPAKILRFFYEYNHDTFSDDLISDETKIALANFGGLPEATEFHFLGTGVDLGLINIDSYRVDGHLLSLNLRYAISPGREDLNFAEGTANFRYYKTLFNNSTFAQRLMAGATNTKVLQYWHYLGGLDRIRGFADNRFSGRYFWLSNSEFRYPFLKTDWVVLQSIAFVDVVANGERLHELSRLGGMSAGAGLRIFLPKVYRFTLRFDYATPIIKNDEINFSFGVQQFF